MISRTLCCLVLVVALGAGCGGDDDDSDGATAQPGQTAAGGAPEWPAPSDPVGLTEAAGLTPERKEHLDTHRHSHLDVFFNGEAVVVPAGIGVNIDDPGVKKGAGPSYGGIEECDEPCISPLHTHDPYGVLHTEARSDELRTLGQFFVEWDVPLDDKCVGDYCAPDTDVAVYVDGDLYDGDPADIQLEDGREIAIVIGDPPEDVPSDFEQ